MKMSKDNLAYVILIGLMGLCMLLVVNIIGLGELFWH
jgi:hypothetical protein